MKLLILISFFFLTNLVFGQIDMNFFIKTTNYATGKKESGVTVKLMEGANTVSTQTTDGSGEVKLLLKAGKKYKVEVSKAGKVSRMLNINVSNVNDELLQGTSKPEGQAQISLFDEQPNVDYSYVKSNPITEFTSTGKTPCCNTTRCWQTKWQRRLRRS